MDAKKDHVIAQLLKDMDYRINEDAGRVERRMKSAKNETWKPVGWYSTNGYIVKYKNYHLSGARIIYAACNGKLKPGLRVVNEDGNRMNNLPHNLVALTNSQTNVRIYQAGRKAANARLTWNEAEEIRTQWGSGNYTQKKLGEKYGISQVAVGLIVNNKTYKRETNHE